MVARGREGWQLYAPGEREATVTLVPSEEEPSWARLASSLEAVERVARERPGLLGEAVRRAAEEGEVGVERVLLEHHLVPRGALSAVLALLAERRPGAFGIEDLEFPPELRVELPRLLGGLEVLGLVSKRAPGVYRLEMPVREFLAWLEAYARELRERLDEGAPPRGEGELEGAPGAKEAPSSDPRPSSGVLRVYSARQRK